MDIGIDLGTTYSVIAVKGRIEPVDDCPDAQYLTECDVSIIPSPFGEFAIPSAFWCNPEDAPPPASPVAASQTHAR